MSRIGGPFPFPLTGPQLQGLPGIVQLASGEIYYPPAGQYLFSAGQQTVLQWFDPNNGTWRSVCAPNEYTTFGSDGSNYRMVNYSGIVQGAAITNAGSGGTNGIGPIQTGSTVSFAAPASGLAVDTAQGYVIVGGSVPAPTITQAGSGFLVPPIVVCDPPPAGGIQATFTVDLTSAGALTGIAQVNPGAGYTSIPQFYIIPQFQYYNGAPRWPGDTVPLPGVPIASNWAPGLIHPNNLWNGSPYQGNQSSALGALLTGNALTGTGTLTGLVTTYYGADYDGTHIPAVSFAGTSLGAAAATAVMSLACTAYSGTTGAGFQVGNPWVSSLGKGTATVGLISAAINNQVLQPRPARGALTATTGATASIEDPGFGIQAVPGAGIATGALITTSTVITLTMGAVTDSSILQPMVQ
jgi:hypothetical protein